MQPAVLCFRTAGSKMGCRFATMFLLGIFVTKAGVLLCFHIGGCDRKVKNDKGGRTKCFMIGNSRKTKASLLYQ